jgi:hypothetical protein
MELTGKITRLLTLQSGEGKNGIWKKQEYLLEYGDQYPKTVCFNLWGDNIDQYKLSEGETVTVFFDVESREFNGRFYTDVKAWRIDKNTTQDDSQSGSVQAHSEFGVPADSFTKADEKDDLPF